MLRIISVFMLVISTQAFAGDIYLICEDRRTSDFVLDVLIEMDHGVSTSGSFVDQYSSETQFLIDYRHDNRLMQIKQKINGEVISTINYSDVDFQKPVKVGLDYLCFIAD